MNSIFYQILLEIANNTSNTIILLDDQGKIIFVNKNFYRFLGIKNDSEIIGKSIKDIFAMEDSKAQIIECHLYQLLEKAIIEGSIKRKCRFINRENMSTNVEINIKKFKQSDDEMILITIEDISRENRDKILERLFFHDLMNSAGGLNGLAQLMHEGVEMSTDEISEMLNSLTGKLLKDIYDYRILYKAENGSLVPNIEKLDNNWIQDHVLKNVKELKGLKNIRIKFEIDEDLTFYSDPQIIEQIFINMIKNAWKAREEDETIVMKVKSEGERIKFSVLNKKYIDPENRILIFQKSLSQDVFASGLGTYMMKLYGEKYLGGEVDYITDQLSGTEFYIRIKNK